MSSTPAAELARLRVQFPDWRIIRTECGTFIARHRATSACVQARELTGLETLLREQSWGHPAPGATGHPPA